MSHLPPDSRGSIHDSQKIGEGESPPYMREEECRLLSSGSLLLLLFVLDLFYALGEGGVATITDGRNIGEGVPLQDICQLVTLTIGR